MENKIKIDEETEVTIKFKVLQDLLIIKGKYESLKELYFSKPNSLYRSTDITGPEEFNDYLPKHKNNIF